ncbi:restriction endonuclease subunit S [Shimazuella sp. AN120528]|uniref:restriction endonuclease subunit S n=1 Tax=Shimazuella soli TaxID=1892854 RepID=UPI001F10981B|nr:restriction endonuclease subunit S [Shimazuella soli]MCH5584069.1 restriction endonuclease subunit S [Shimazuella soli]
MSFIKESLGEVCSIKGGYAFKSTDFKTEGIPVIKIANIVNKKIIFDKDSSFISSSVLENFKDFLVNKGDILVALSGATTGKFGIYDSDEIALLNQRVAKIVPLNNKINHKYLFYCMTDLQDKVLQKANGAAQPNVSPKEISEFRIPLPSYEVQMRVSNVISKAQELIDKRKAQIESLDQLAKSLFWDMFGDPALNKKQWITKEIVNLVKERKDLVDGPFGSNLKVSDFSDKGVRVIQINNIGVNRFIDKNRKFITHEKFRSLIKHNVLPGDIVIAKMGEPLGRTCIIPQSLSSGIIVADCMRLRPNVEIVNRNYLTFLLNSNYVKNQFKKLSRGSTRIRLNLSMLKTVKLILPPIELQNNFANIVQKIEAQKTLLQQSLTELENNFQSLMQKAFRGELFPEEELEVKQDTPSQTQGTLSFT